MSDIQDKVISSKRMFLIEKGEYKKELEFIQECLESWKTLRLDDEVVFQIFPFGISRATYKVHAPNRPDITPNPIILRRFLHEPTSKELEYSDMLGDSGVGPKCF